MNDVNEVLKKVMKDHDVTQVEIANLFGVSSQAVNNKFKRGTWNADEVVKVLEYMNCRVIIESGDIVRYRL